MGLLAPEREREREEREESKRENEGETAFVRMLSTDTLIGAPKMLNLSPRSSSMRREITK